MSGFFRRYFSQIDGPEPHLVLDLVDDDLRFAVLFSTESTSEPREFSGGRAELAAYLEQRGQPSWTHHVLHEAVVDGIELALGETRYPDGRLAATFVHAGRVGADGRLERYMVARTPAIRF